MIIDSIHGQSGPPEGASADPETGAAAVGADAPGPAQSEAVNINASIVSNGKHVKVIIEDAAVVGELISAATGHPELAAAIALIVKYSGTAIEGAVDSSVIVINHASIAALLENVKLDPPTS